MAVDLLNQINELFIVLMMNLENQIRRLDVRLLPTTRNWNGVTLPAGGGNQHLESLMRLAMGRRDWSEEEEW